MYLDFLTRPVGNRCFRKLRDGDTLTSGDLYKIVVQAETETYLYIYQLDATGALFRLFPMVTYKGLQLNNRNPLQPGRRYHLPTATKAFKLDHNRGKEAFYVLVSRQPRPQVETLPTLLAKTRREKKPMSAASAKERLKVLFKSRDLPMDSVEPKANAPTYTFPQDGKLFDMVPGYFRNLCADCVYVLEFGHR